MSAESLRSGTEIDHDIKHLALDNGDKLCLGILSFLEVEPADHSPCGTALVVLDEIYIETCQTGEFPLAVTLEKIPSRIAEDLRLEDIKTFDAGFDQLHLSLFFRKS